jgi:hypothetical protein
LRILKAAVKIVLNYEGIKGEPSSIYMNGDTPYCEVRCGRREV